MRKEYASLRRRPLLAPVWLTGLAAALVIAAQAWLWLAADTTTILVLRHAEKAEAPAGDPLLSLEGETHAAELAALLSGGPAEFRPQGIIVSEFRRTQETVRPLANRLSIPVLVMPSDEIKATVERALEEFHGGRVLIVGHSNTVPEIVRRLSGSAVPPIGEDQYGTLYIVAKPRFGRAAVTRFDLPW